LGNFASLNPIFSRFKTETILTSHFCKHRGAVAFLSPKIMLLATNMPSINANNPAFFKIVRLVGLAKPEYEYTLHSDTVSKTYRLFQRVFARIVGV